MAASWGSGPPLVLRLGALDGGVACPQAVEAALGAEGGRVAGRLAVGAVVARRRQQRLGLPQLVCQAWAAPAARAGSVGGLGGGV